MGDDNPFVVNWGADSSHQREHGRTRALQGQHLDRAILANHQDRICLHQPRGHCARTQARHRTVYRILQQSAATSGHRTVYRILQQSAATSGHRTSDTDQAISTVCLKKIMNWLCRKEYNNYLCTTQEKDDGYCYAVGHEKDSGTCCLLS